MKKIITQSRSFVLSALALAMTACSTIPPKVQEQVVAQPMIPVEQSFEVFDKETTISTPESPSMASVRWQEFYADPKLIALIEIGLEHNKDLQSAILAIQNAKAQYQISESSTYPSVGVSSSATRSGTSSGDGNSKFSVGLGMSQYEVDLWGKVASQKESALHDYLAKNSAKDAVQISLISNIAKSYVNLSYALAQRQLALETLKTREHSLFINNKRFEAGIDAKSTSLQAAASLELAKIAINQADTGILKARNALQFLIGQPVPDELIPVMAVNEITTQNLFSTGLPSELLYYRPDIVQAEHALKSAGAKINVARASYFPSITLSSSLGFGSANLKDLFKSGGFNWSFGPNVSLPIFDAGARRANYEMAQIGQKQALVAYEKTIQTAFKEVLDVLADRATLEQQLASQYRLQENFQQTYNIAHARFRSGLDNYLNVLDAERSLFDNQKGILNLELQKITSQIELYQVLGGGASLSAEEIAQFRQQREAMQTASLATPEQLVRVVDEAELVKRKLVQPKPENINVVEPLNDDGIAVTPKSATATDDTEQ